MKYKYTMALISPFRRKVKGFIFSHSSYYGKAAPLSSNIQYISS